jgi:hypothetical protein
LYWINRLFRWMASATTSTAFVAALWLWSSLPYVESWYRAKARPSGLESLCFQLYPFPWSVFLFGALFFVFIQRCLRLREGSGLFSFIIVCLSIGVVVICCLSGILIRRFTTVPALDWDPPRPSLTTLSFNLLLLCLGCMGVVAEWRRRE